MLIKVKCIDNHPHEAFFDPPPSLTLDKVYEVNDCDGVTFGIDGRYWNKTRFVKVEDMENNKPILVKSLTNLYGLLEGYTYEVIQHPVFLDSYTLHYNNSNKIFAKSLFQTIKENEVPKEAEMVRCIDSEGSSYLAWNKEYEVLSREEPGLFLKEYPNVWFFNSRFVPADSPPIKWLKRVKCIDDKNSASQLSNGKEYEVDGEDVTSDNYSIKGITSSSFRKSRFEEVKEVQAKCISINPPIPLISNSVYQIRQSSDPNQWELSDGSRWNKSRFQIIEETKKMNVSNLPKFVRCLDADYSHTALVKEKIYEVIGESYDKDYLLKDVKWSWKKERFENFEPTKPEQALPQYATFKNGSRFGAIYPVISQLDGHTFLDGTWCADVDLDFIFDLNPFVNKEAVKHVQLSGNKYSGDKLSKDKIYEVEREISVGYILKDFPTSIWSKSIFEIMEAPTTPEKVIDVSEKTIGKVQCIDADGSVRLHLDDIYDLVGEDNNSFNIKFDGMTFSYPKSQFKKLIKKVRYIKNTASSLTTDKIYDIVSESNDRYIIVDNNNRQDSYPKTDFETIYFWPAISTKKPDEAISTKEIVEVKSKDQAGFLLAFLGAGLFLSQLSSSNTKSKNKSKNITNEI